MLIRFTVYIAGGIVVFILNVFYFIALVRTKATRKRFALIGIEFFADSLNGLAIAIAGATRTIEILSGTTNNSTVSKMICIIMPHNIILAWAEPMTAISMLVVSIDRLISIGKPILYFKKMLNIQHSLIIGSNLLIFLLIFANVICSYWNDAQVHLFCWTPNSRCPLFNRIYFGTRIAAAFGSVVFYIITLLMARRYLRRIKNQQNFRAIKINSRQLNFTKTVCLSCFATVGLYILPMILAFFKSSNEFISLNVYSTIVLVSFLNSLSKTIIVGSCSLEIREALIDTLPGLFNKFGLRKLQKTVVTEVRLKKTGTINRSRS